MGTQARSLDEAFLSAAFPGQGLTPGPYAVLEVGDTGIGMTPEVLSRIFDPFFTTKPTGHGLGLSAIQGILRGHRGGLKVYSEPGRGTSFQVYLPATSRPLPPAPSTPSNPAGVALGGLVLLVDDEQSILEVTAKALERLGFQVETAADGKEAVERFSTRPSAFRLALVDLTMPRMDGRECFKALRALRPDLPVVLCSGSASRSRSRPSWARGWRDSSRSPIPWARCGRPSSRPCTPDPPRHGPVGPPGAAAGALGEGPAGPSPHQGVETGVTSSSSPHLSQGVPP
ncbi:MAG: response regulator [Holophagaceae bacterium]